MMKGNTYFQDRMAELGITDEHNCFQTTVEGQPQQLRYFSEDKHGNIRILYRNLDGEPQTVLSKSRKEQPLYVVRQHPDRLKENSGPKYLAPAGSGIRFFYPPKVIQAYRDGQGIQTLFITEGAFKAFKGDMHGLPIIGSMGIHTMSEGKGSKKLHAELKQLIETYQVKKLVFLLDSDLFDLSAKEGKPETARPYSFFKAVCNFRRLMEPYETDVWFAYLKPQKGYPKLGLDDLLIEVQKGAISTWTERLQIDSKHNRKPIDFQVEKANQNNEIPGSILFVREQQKLNEISPIQNLKSPDFTAIKADILPNLVLEDLQKTVQSHAQNGTFFCAYSLSEMTETKIKKHFGLDSPQNFFLTYKKQLKDSFRFHNRRFDIKGDEIELVQVKHITDLFEKDGRYFKKGRDKTVTLSNFVLRGKYLITSNKGEALRVVEIIPMIGEQTMAAIKVNDTLSLRDFRSQIESMGNLFWMGKQGDLDELRALIFGDLPKAQPVKELGYHPELEVFVWSNGVYLPEKALLPDKIGVVKLPNRNIFLPYHSSLDGYGGTEYRNERRFFYQSSAWTFEQWAEQVILVFGKDKHLAIAYFAASLYRDLIFEALGYFPILMLFGMQGSGKTSLMRCLLGMFGKGQEIMNLGTSSTAKSYARKLSQFRNGLVGFDEYKNSLDTKLISSIKATYDGASYHRATTSQDNRTHSLEVQSSVMLAGQEIPITEEAFLTRMIVLEFFENQRTEAEKDRYLHLAQVSQTGLSQITNELTWYRAEIAADFQKTHKEIRHQIVTQLSKYDHQIQTRLVDNYAVLLAACAVLARRKKIKFPLTESEQIEDAVRHIIRQTEELTGINEVQVFWQDVENMHSRGFIHEGQHFIVEEEHNRIYLAFGYMYGIYSEAYRKQFGKNPIDKQTLRQYLYHSDAFLEKKQKKFRGQNKQALVFDLGQLSIDLTPPPTNSSYD